jgi:hypothetical protein
MGEDILKRGTRGGIFAAGCNILLARGNRGDFHGNPHAD